MKKIYHLNHSEGWAVVDGDSIPIPTGTNLLTHYFIYLEVKIS